LRPVHLAYQPLGSITFFSEQTNNQPVLFSQNKSAPATGHLTNEQASGDWRTSVFIRKKIGAVGLSV
jgi:hypothetical protein